MTTGYSTFNDSIVEKDLDALIFELSGLDRTERNVRAASAAYRNATDETVRSAIEDFILFSKKPFIPSERKNNANISPERVFLEYAPVVDEATLERWASKDSRSMDVMHALAGVRFSPDEEEPKCVLSGVVYSIGTAISEFVRRRFPVAEPFVAKSRSGAYLGDCASRLHVLVEAARSEMRTMGEFERSSYAETVFESMTLFLDEMKNDPLRNNGGSFRRKEVAEIVLGFVDERCSPLRRLEARLVLCGYGILSTGDVFSGLDDCGGAESVLRSVSGPDAPRIVRIAKHLFAERNRSFLPSAFAGAVQGKGRRNDVREFARAMFANEHLRRAAAERTDMWNVAAEHLERAELRLFMLEIVRCGNAKNEASAREFVEAGCFDRVSSRDERARMLFEYAVSSVREIVSEMRGGADVPYALRTFAYERLKVFVANEYSSRVRSSGASDSLRPSGGFSVSPDEADDAFELLVEVLPDKGVPFAIAEIASFDDGTEYGAGSGRRRLLAAVRALPAMSPELDKVAAMERLTELAPEKIPELFGEERAARRIARSFLETDDGYFAGYAARYASRMEDHPISMREAAGTYLERARTENSPSLLAAAAVCALAASDLPLFALLSEEFARSADAPSALSFFSRLFSLYSGAFPNAALSVLDAWTERAAETFASLVERLGEPETAARFIAVHCVVRGRTGSPDEARADAVVTRALRTLATSSTRAAADFFDFSDRNRRERVSGTCPRSLTSAEMRVAADLLLDSPGFAEEISERRTPYFIKRLAGASSFGRPAKRFVEYETEALLKAISVDHGRMCPELLGSGSSSGGVAALGTFGSSDMTTRISGEMPLGLARCAARRLAEFGDNESVRDFLRSWKHEFLACVLVGEDVLRRSKYGVDALGFARKYRSRGVRAAVSMVASFDDEFIGRLLELCDGREAVMKKEVPAFQRTDMSVFRKLREYLERGGSAELALGMYGVVKQMTELAYASEEPYVSEIECFKAALAARFAVAARDDETAAGDDEMFEPCL